MAGEAPWLSHPSAAAGTKAWCWWPGVTHRVLVTNPGGTDGDRVWDGAGGFSPGLSLCRDP